MNKTSANNRKNPVPQWQADKMKMIIANRWSEVWQIVEVRANHQRKYYE